MLTRKPALLSLLTLACALALPSAARAQEVQVLRGRRTLTGLSSNGNGASIDRLQVSVDLRVQNLAYEKVVGVRYTLDDWATTTDATGYWVEDFEDGSEHWRVDVDAGTVGRNVMVGLGRGDEGPSWFRFAAFYRVKGATFWDNAGGHDHAVAILAPAADPLPQARVHPATALVQGRLYLVGGHSNEAYGFQVPDVLSLDPETGAWSKVADLPTLASSAQPGQPTSPEILSRIEVAGANGKLYIAGGELIHVGGWPLGTAALDLATGRWTARALLPGPLFDRRAVPSASGYDLVPTTADRGATGDTGEAFVYDAAKDSFTRAAIAGIDLLSGHDYATAVLGGKLYFFGSPASPAGAAPGEVLVYDPATRSIARLATAPGPIAAGAQAVALGDSRIAVANVNPDLGRGTSDVLVFDVLANQLARLANQPLLPWAAGLAPVPPAVVESPNGSVATVAPFLVITGTTRVDVAEPFAGVLARGVARTVVRVHASVGAGHSVTLRGSAAPLSWWSGTPMVWTAGDVWAWDSTDVLDPLFRLKPLVDDQRWYAGADVNVAPGDTITIDGLR